MNNVLIIDDDKDFQLLIERQLKQHEFNCFKCGTSVQAFEVLEGEKVDLVLCDLNLRKENAKDILIEMKDRFYNVPVIIVTGYNNVRSAVDMMRLGAVDYLVKPLVTTELVFLINKHIAEFPKRTKRVGTPPAPMLQKSSGYVFSPGPYSKEILDQINLVAPTDYSVIIYGESGSGKEAYAQEIHKRSQRKAKPFLAIDCGALSKELSASILFGHEKGAFTGAIAEKEGAFESAEGGTIFLDEIANLSYEIQVSLLRVMQQRSVRRVGGTKDIPIDVRVIVASNKKLWEACRSGDFREDLYHRFNEFAIDVKPLRDRKSDILFYASHFLAQSNIELNKKVVAFTGNATTAILEYPWPGNLRELRNLVRRSVLITQSDYIDTDILPAEFFQAVTPNRSLGEVNASNPVSNSEQYDYNKIVDALEKTSFDKKKASALLGMDVKTINTRIRKSSKTGDSQGEYQ